MKRREAAACPVATNRPVLGGWHGLRPTGNA